MPVNSKPSETDYLARQAEQINRNARAAEALNKRNYIGPWVPADLLNNFDNAGAPYADVAYRLVGDEVQFKGHLDASAATSGTTAFILTKACRPPHDISYLTDMLTSASTFSTVRVSITASTGAVKLRW